MGWKSLPNHPKAVELLTFRTFHTRIECCSKIVLLFTPLFLLLLPIILIKIISLERNTLNCNLTHFLLGGICLGVKYKEIKNYFIQ